MDKTDNCKQYETGVTYNSEKAKELPAGMYLGLFHGRKSANEQLNDWGFDGPIIGPLKWVHTTYQNHIRFCPITEEDGIDLRFNEDLLTWDGKFYGDFTVFRIERAETNDETLQALKALVKFVKRTTSLIPVELIKAQLIIDKSESKA